MSVEEEILRLNRSGAFNDALPLTESWLREVDHSEAVKRWMMIAIIEQIVLGIQERLVPAVGEMAALHFTSQYLEQSGGHLTNEERGAIQSQLRANIARADRSN